jgi:hypothetical protein
VFIPRAHWTTYLGSHDEIVPYYEAETAAIRDRNPIAARVACLDRSEVLGRIT